MKTIRSRIRLSLERDAGLSLVEVIVAMMIFAIISTGAIYSMIQILSVTRDTRAREVATQLAAEEIDRARSIEDVTTIASWSTDSGDADANDARRANGPITLNGDVFHVQRTVGWFSDPDSSTTPSTCNASADSIRFLRVNVRVTWDGMRGSASPVQSDTVINPNAPINDPEMGSILVSVLSAGGTGVEGVRVSTTPSSTTSTTDEQGCAYLINATPRMYTVNVNKAGYVDQLNSPNPMRDKVVVEKGNTRAVSFQLDQGNSFTMKYPATPPTNIDVSFINTLRTAVMRGSATYLMQQASSGYTIVAGDAVKCPAADPRNWTTGASYQPIDLLPYSASPGTSLEVPVPMAVLTVTGIASDRYIRATSVTGTGHPACTATVTYQFAVGSSTITLPYGSWKLESINDSNVVAVSRTSVVLPPGSTYGTAASVVTLDPRVAKGGGE